MEETPISGSEQSSPPPPLMFLREGQGEVCVATLSRWQLISRGQMGKREDHARAVPADVGSWGPGGTS